MKKLVLTLLASAFAFVSFGAYAANAPIGVIDMRLLMEKSPQIAQIRNNLRKEFDPRQKKLVAAQATLKNDADRLRRDNAIMNNNDRKQLEQKILAEQSDLQKTQMSFQQDLMNAQNKALKGFLDNVKGIVSKIAKDDNLTLVITKDTVAYENGLDITNKVLAQLPKK